MFSPGTLSFSATADSSTMPSPQTIQVTASDGSHVPFTVGPAGGAYNGYPQFVAASPSSATTPAIITISLIPQQVYYLDTFSGNAVGWPWLVGLVEAFTPVPPSTANGGLYEVTLMLALPPPPVITSIVNAASGLPGVSPGELVTITGENIVPGPLSYSYNDTSQCEAGEGECYPTSFYGTRVTFDGSYAPIYEAGIGSLSVIIPYEPYATPATGQGLQVALEHLGQTATATAAPFADTSPGIFPGSLINADFTLNSASNPAPAGSVVTLMATGSGAWNGTVYAGFVLTGIYQTAAPVSLTVGGQPAVLPSASSLAGDDALGDQLTVQFVVPSGLPPGPQPLVLTVGKNSSAPQQITVGVENPVKPAIATVVNAASFAPGLSPGTLVTLFGESLGHPAQADQTTWWYGQTVTFNGVVAPVLYADSGQVNAIVPYEMAGQTNADLIVTYYGVASPPVTAPIEDTSPAIFTLTGTGSGQGAILNTDNTVNSAKNPAAIGSVIQIYATGAGLWNAQNVDGFGQIPGRPIAPYPLPLASVSVSIGGLSAPIEYAGAAPTLVTGVLQVNAVVPSGLAPGPQPIVLTVGTADNQQQKVTVAVQ